MVLCGGEARAVGNLHVKENRFSLDLCALHPLGADCVQ